MINQTTTTTHAEASGEGDEPPVFPAQAPEALTDPANAVRLLAPVLEALGQVIEVPEDRLGSPTPCRDFTVGELQRHVLAWLQFFADSYATAVAGPGEAVERVDPETWVMPTGPDAASPSTIVAEAAERLLDATRAGVGDELVVMSQARMRGDAVVAMALGEYIVHGWDLTHPAATSDTGDAPAWSVSDEACEAALAFLQITVAPEYRGEDSGFFGAEVPVADDAPALDRLLGFSGRKPGGDYG